MRRNGLIFIIVLLLGITSTLSSFQGVRLIKPYAGTHWKIGDTRWITWDSKGLNPDLSVICLLCDRFGNKKGKIKFLPPPPGNRKLGHHNGKWIVGKLDSPTFIPSGRYRIKIIVSKNIATHLGGVFEIYNPVGLKLKKDNNIKPLIKIQLPVANENWILGKMQRITWNLRRLKANKLNLELLKNGKKVADIAKNLHNMGYYLWKVGYVLGGQKFTGINFSIRFTNIDNKPIGVTSKFNIILQLKKLNLRKKD